MLPDLAAEAELSSVASSPAAPSSLMHGQEMTNIMTHMASITSTSMPNTPPMVLPHTTSSVMVSMAPVLPPLIPSTPPPVPAPPPPPAFVCDYQGCGAVSNDFFFFHRCIIFKALKKFPVPFIPLLLFKHLF